MKFLLIILVFQFCLYGNNDSLKINNASFVFSEVFYNYERDQSNLSVKDWLKKFTDRILLIQYAEKDSLLLQEAKIRAKHFFRNQLISEKGEIYKYAILDSVNLTNQLIETALIKSKKVSQLFTFWSDNKNDITDFIKTFKTENDFSTSFPEENFYTLSFRYPTENFWEFQDEIYEMDKKTFSRVFHSNNEFICFYVTDFVFIDHLSREDSIQVKKHLHKSLVNKRKNEINKQILNKFPCKIFESNLEKTFFYLKQFNDEYTYSKCLELKSVLNNIPLIEIKGNQNKIIFTAYDLVLKLMSSFSYSLISDKHSISKLITDYYYDYCFYIENIDDLLAKFPELKLLKKRISRRMLSDRFKYYYPGKVNRYKTKELKAYFDENKNQFTSIDTIACDVFEFETLTKAIEFHKTFINLNLIKKSFYKSIEKHSLISKKTYQNLPGLFENIKNLSVGSLTPPVKIKSSYYVFQKKEDYKKLLDFTEVKDEIRIKLNQKNANEVIEKLLKTLREQANISGIKKFYNFFKNKTNLKLSH